MSVIERSLAGLKKAGGLILPMLADPRDFAGLSPAAWWALRTLALCVTLAVLGAINYLLKIPLSLKPPHPWLGHVWLPLLFLLLNLLCWLAWALWRVIGSGREGEAFPEIERAWREAVQALERAGIRLNETPLFLILGRPQVSEAALFESAELSLKVRGQPARDDAPIRVFASREAIYLTCAGASVLAQSSRLVEPENFELPPDATIDEGKFGSLGATGMFAFGEASEILASAQLAAQGPGQLHEEQVRDYGRMASEKAASEWGDPVQGSGRAIPVQNKAVLKLQEDRLRHLGRLVARDRRPYCPINGILLLIPVSATNSDNSASAIGQLCQRDLGAVRDSTHVVCPTFAMVCDLELLPGFGELMARLPVDDRRRRMGQRFPLIPDVAPSELEGLFERGVNWIAEKQFPARVDSLWRVEAGGELTMAEAVRGNVQLYRLLQQVRHRLRRLGRLLRHAVAPEGKPSTMLGGCYLAGIGADPRTEQAFVPGVFRRLTENQDFVSWTPEELAREVADAWKIRIGYIVLGVLTMLFVSLVAFKLLLNR